MEEVEAQVLRVLAEEAEPQEAPLAMAKMVKMDLVF
jgi:hypothetical protein